MVYFESLKLNSLAPNLELEEPNPQPEKESTFFGGKERLRYVAHNLQWYLIIQPIRIYLLSFSSIANGHIRVVAFGHLSDLIPTMLQKVTQLE